jgi:excisionase family DNA binding protein
MANDDATTNGNGNAEFGDVGTVQEAAKVGHCSVPTIYQMIREGKALAYKRGTRTLVDLDSVRRGIRLVPLVLSPAKPKPNNFHTKKVKAAPPAKGRRSKAKRGKRSHELRPST